MDSEIYHGAAVADVPVDTYPFPTYSRRSRGGKGRSDTLLLFQMSTGSPLSGYLLRRPEPIAINYHNITPSTVFYDWDSRVADELDRGRDELSALSRRTVHAIAVSRYNEEELVSAGFSSTSVAPILFDTDGFDNPADRETGEWLDRDRSRGGKNILFVGRVVPNKAHHDLIAAFAAFRRLYDPHARLYLVGGCPVPTYQSALRRLAYDLGVHRAIDFSGFVTDEQLAAYYQAADVFVCLSDHEGFCVPLLEAMFHGVPIVAYAAGAVPETLGDGGLLLPNKGPVAVAAAVHRVVEDEVLSKTLARAGEARLADFSLEASRRAFRSSLTKALESVESYNRAG